MNGLLGIDTGGTKCETLLVQDSGEVMGWGRSDGNDPGSRLSAKGGIGRSPETVSRALVQALGNHRFNDLQVMSIRNFRKTWVIPSTVADTIRWHTTSEWKAALALAGVDYGIVALAGTGAVVYAQTRQGRRRYFDGLGPVLGDCGGGYQIGLQGLRAAAKASLHPRHQTSLADAINHTFLGKNGGLVNDDLVDFMAYRDRATIAAAARSVDAEARAGDPVASRILQAQAGELAETVRDAVDQFHMRDDEYTLVATGGVLLSSAIYRDAFFRAVHRFAPNLTPYCSDLPPVAGLIMVMLNKIHGSNAAEPARIFLQSARNYFAKIAKQKKDKGQH